MNQNNRLHRSLVRPAFTLMEILIVVVLVGILLAWIGPKIMQQVKQFQARQTRLVLQDIKSKLEIYRLDIGSYPKSLQELSSNVANNPKWQGPYYEGELVDQWNNEVVYNKPPRLIEGRFKSYELISFGSDGADEQAPRDQWIIEGK